MRDAPRGSAARTYLVHLGDQRRARTDSHGIINFSLGLTRALPRALDDRTRLVVFANDELAAELGEDFLRAGDEVLTTPAPTSTLQRLAVDHARVLAAARHVAADVILYPKGFLPLRTRRPRTGARQVVCLHDDIPFRLRSDRSLPLRRRLRAAYFARLISWSMRASDRRLFVSRFSQGQLVRRTGATRPDDVVTHQGITLPRRPLVPLRDRLPQAVVFGSHHPHKQVEPLIERWAAERPAAGAIDRLVVLGHLAAGVREGSTIEIDHRPEVLAGHELAQLIGHSRLLLFPSVYEGFGLPPIEAYALGTPAVHHRTGAAREVLAHVPGGYDDAGSSLADAVAEALAIDDDGLARLSANMWRRYDWDSVARRVADALAVVGRPR